MTSALKCRSVNLKQDMPSVPQARARLQEALAQARRDGVKLLKVIHGYGSSGVGGDLRIALQATLRQMESAGQITACIYGENWSRSDERTWELLKRFPALKDDADLGKRNQGISVVLL